jgi:hypothetical protein
MTMDLRITAASLRFLREDGAPDRGDGGASGAASLLDAIGPALYAAIGEQLIPVPSWTLITMRRLAADCAEHVLPRFESVYPGDARPREAIAAGRTGVAPHASLNAARAAVTASKDAQASAVATVEEWRSETVSVRERYCQFAAASWAARAAARAARTKNAQTCRATLQAVREAARLAGLGQPDAGERTPDGVLFKSPNRRQRSLTALADEAAWQQGRLLE